MSDAVWLIHEWMVENDLAYSFDFPTMVLWPQRYYRLSNIRGPRLSMVDSDIYYGNLAYLIGNLSHPRIFDIIIAIIEKWEEFDDGGYYDFSFILQTVAHTSSRSN